MEIRESGSNINYKTITLDRLLVRMVVSNTLIRFNNYTMSVATRRCLLEIFSG